MALYLISYDIAAKNHDYQSLWDRLAQLKATKILYSEWLLPVASQGRERYAIGLANDLEKHIILPGDSLLVQEVGQDAAWSGKLRISNEQMGRLIANCRF
jgi:hypothetical protein